MDFFAEEEAERDSDGVAEPIALAVPAALPVGEWLGVCEPPLAQYWIALQYTRTVPLPPGKPAAPPAAPA